MKKHAHTPHIYVVCWPNLTVVKIGISTKSRWTVWRNQGAKEIATITTCCIPHALRIEKYLHRMIARHYPRAFIDREAARVAMHGGVGYSECFQLERSPLAGETPESPYDYERAYGIRLPDELRETLDHYVIAWHPVAVSA